MQFCVEMLLLGGAVGFISVALGLGGGILMVPAFLEFVPGMDAHTAKGTSLFILVFVAAVNTWRLRLGNGPMQWRTATMIACGSIVGSWLGVWITGNLSERAVIWFFVAIIGAEGVRTLFLKTPADARTETKCRHLASVLIGVATGFVAGGTGIGGGLILVPLALRMGLSTNERVVALSNMVMVATCIPGAAAHLFSRQTTELAWTYGQVDLALPPLVFLGAQMIAPFGRRINEKLTLPRRKVVMGLLMLLIAARLMYRSLT